MKVKIKAIVFDMGGVLLGTSDFAPREKLAKHYQIPRKKLEYLIFFSDMGKKAEVGNVTQEQLFEYVLKELGDTKRNWLDFVEEFFSGDTVNHEMVKFAAYFKPRFRLGMFSNAFTGAREWLSKKFDFFDIFDQTIFSYEIKARKPHPEAYAILCARMDTKPQETVFIDDFYENVVGAREFGIHAIHFIDKQHVISELKDVLFEKN